MRTTPIPFLLFVSVLAGCQVEQTSVGPFGRTMSGASEMPTPEQSPWDAPAGEPQDQSSLYGWDGSVVDSSVPGSVQRNDTAGERHLEGTGGSRLVLLELYERAVDERDEYILETQHQNRELELAEERFAELQVRFEELSTSFDILSAEKATADERARDLAARLATAQIRRLEAEKAWLEAAIAAEREASILNAPGKDGLR